MNFITNRVRRFFLTRKHTVREITTEVETAFKTAIKRIENTELNEKQAEKLMDMIKNKEAYSLDEKKEFYRYLTSTLHKPAKDIWVNVLLKHQQDISLLGKEDYVQFLNFQYNWTLAWTAAIKTHMDELGYVYNIAVTNNHLPSN